MKTSIPLSIKIRDIAKGFFGWLIFSNLVFFVLSFGLGFFVKYKDYYIFLSVLSSIIWLSTIISGVFLYSKKKTRILAGVLIAFVINGVTMNALNIGDSARSFGKAIRLMGFPIPSFVIPFIFIGQ